MSFSRTGPFTLRMMDRVESSMNSTRTWVTPPLLPVLPRTLTTFASLTWVFVESCWWCWWCRCCWWRVGRSVDWRWRLLSEGVGQPYEWSIAGGKPAAATGSA